VRAQQKGEARRRGGTQNTETDRSMERTETLEGVVDSAAGHLHDDLLDGLRVLGRVHAIGRAQLLRCAHAVRASASQKRKKAK
jgi:hypothetical protein